jgi:hypothetical protein
MIDRALSRSPQVSEVNLLNPRPQTFDAFAAVIIVGVVLWLAER